MLTRRCRAIPVHSAPFSWCKRRRPPPRACVLRLDVLHSTPWFGSRNFSIWGLICSPYEIWHLIRKPFRIWHGACKLFYFRCFSSFFSIFTLLYFPFIHHAIGKHVPTPSLIPRANTSISGLVKKLKREKREIEEKGWETSKMKQFASTIQILKSLRIVCRIPWGTQVQSFRQVWPALLPCNCRSFNLSWCY